MKEPRRLAEINLTYIHHEVRRKEVFKLFYDNKNNQYIFTHAASYDYDYDDIDSNTILFQTEFECLDAVKDIFHNYLEAIKDDGYFEEDEIIFDPKEVKTHDDYPGPYSGDAFVCVYSEFPLSSVEQLLQPFGVEKAITNIWLEEVAKFFQENPYDEAV